MLYDFMHTIYDPYSDEAVAKVIDIMTADKPVWFGRIGGSDCDAARQYYYHGDVNQHSRKLVLTHNGYFDKNGKESNFTKYLEAYIESCQHMDIATVGMSKYITKIIDDRDTEYIRFFRVQDIMGYSFIEAVTPFMKSFKVWGEGKKILIISPLSKSIEHQIKRLPHISKLEWPNCEFITYNSAITYASANSTPKYKQYFDETTAGIDDWHAMLNKMYRDIKSIDFDIAWLSCGSYAMPLGQKIKTKLRKKAIYIGGSLNCFFNIYGERYKQYLPVVAPIDYQIDPFENDLFHDDSMTLGEENACFGVNKQKNTT